MIPWGLFQSKPELVILVPFLYVLWQIYVPQLAEKLLGDPSTSGYAYETWWTKTRRSFMNEFSRIDSRVDGIGNDVERIAETQEDLVNVTIAQSQMMNGRDSDMDVDRVEKTLLDEREDRPRDYLDDCNTEAD